MPYSKSPAQPNPDGNVARSLATFFDLSSALALSDAENRALLDVPAQTAASLRTGPMGITAGEQAKLLRRLDYAISILERMLVSMTA